MRTKKLSFAVVIGMKHLLLRTIRFTGIELFKCFQFDFWFKLFSSLNIRDWSYQFKGNFTVKFYSDTSATGKGFRLHFRSSKFNTCKYQFKPKINVRIFDRG